MDKSTKMCSEIVFIQMNGMHRTNFRKTIQLITKYIFFYFVFMNRYKCGRRSLWIFVRCEKKVAMKVFLGEVYNNKRLYVYLAFGFQRPNESNITQNVSSRSRWGGDQKITSQPFDMANTEIHIKSNDSQFGDALQFDHVHFVLMIIFIRCYC